MSRGLLVAGLASALLAGAVTCVASLAVHDRSWPWWVLALAAPVTAAVALRRGGLRLGFVLGWVLVLMLAVLGRPEGDYVVTATPRGYGLLAGGLGLLGFAVVTLPRPRGRAT